VNAPRVLSENVANRVQVLCALDHQLASNTFGNLDVALEQSRVLEAKVKGSNGHTLRNSAEVEDRLLAETSQIEQNIIALLQRIEDHFGTACKSLVLVLWVEEVLKLLNVL